MGDANNELSLAQERAALVEDKAASAQEEADEKKAKAEELLKTVDGLAGLAREAAAAAAAERAKAIAAHTAAVAKAYETAHILKSFVSGDLYLVNVLGADFSHKFSITSFLSQVLFGVTLQLLI